MVIEIIPPKTKSIAIEKSFASKKVDYIINSDTNAALETFDDNMIDLMITSPSYYLGKNYEDSKQSFEEYIDYHKETIKILYDKISPTGSVYWNVAQTPINDEIIPLGAIFYNIFKETGFYLKNWIIWHFEGGINTKNRFSGRYENILWFVKDKKNYTFNLDDVRVPSKWQSDKRCNPLGKNPTDVWEFSISDLSKEELSYLIQDVQNFQNRENSCEEDNFMYFDRVVNISKEKTIHPCQFPEKMVERLIKASSNPGDLVVDIFAGSGTTLKKSYDLKRKFIGIDRDLEYCKIAANRVQRSNYA